MAVESNDEPAARSAGGCLGPGSRSGPRHGRGDSRAVGPGARLDGHQRSPRGPLVSRHGRAGPPGLRASGPVRSRLRLRDRAGEGGARSHYSPGPGAEKVEGRLRLGQRLRVPPFPPPLLCRRGSNRHVRGASHRCAYVGRARRGGSDGPVRGDRDRLRAAEREAARAAARVRRCPRGRVGAVLFRPSSEKRRSQAIRAVREAGRLGLRVRRPAGRISGGREAQCGLDLDHSRAGA